MSSGDREEEDLRSVALQNATSILLARQRADRELIAAKEALELKSAELAESLSRLRATFESTTDAIAVTDRDGRVTDYNARFLSLWRVGPELVSSPDRALLRDAVVKQVPNREVFLSRLAEIHSTAQPETYDIIELTDGQVFERRSRLQVDQGRPVGRVWSFRDITSYRQAEAELRQQHEWFRVTLSSIGDAVITTDLESKVTFLNPVAEKMSGWSNDEARGLPLKTVFCIVHEETRETVENPITRVLKEGVIVALANHTLLISRDGRETAIEDSAAPIRSISGAVTGAVMVFHDVTERRRAEEALRSSEERLRAVVRQAAVGITLAGLDGRFEEVNQKAVDILGYSEAELLTLKVSDVTHPDDRAETQRLIARLIARETNEYSVEKRYLRKDGTIVWSLTTVTLLKNARGEPHHFVGILEDITQRKQAEAGLQRNEEELRALANSISQLAWMAEADGNIFWYNQKWFDYTGKTLEEMHGWGWQSVHDPVILPGVMEQWSASIRTGVPFEMEFPLRRADGTFRWFLTRANPVRDAANRVTRWFGTNTDVDEVKRAENALRESEARLRVSLDTAALGTWELDLKTDMVSLDSRCQELFGTMGKSVMKSADLAAVGHSGDHEKRRRALRAVITGERDRYELEFRVTEDRWVKANLKPVRDNRGGVVRVVGAVQDVTDLMKARATMEERGKELKQLVDLRTASLQQAVAQMEEFSYSVSHDLRAPLRSIQSYAQVVIEDYGDKVGPEGVEFLQRIVNAGRRMDQLTQDVLTYSKIARAIESVGPVSLERIVEETIEQYAPPDRANAIITVTHPLLPVLGHEPLLVQGISNLLANALKFVAPGTKPQIKFWTERCGKDVRLSVEDNGIGINTDHQARIWGMFERVHPKAKYEGTGIGLAIVRKAVERMGGSVGVESDGVSGSRFWIQLPAAEPTESL